ncbi:MAG TPA: DUF1800 domain-containing protein [Ktedonobacterales bacterium]|nr:DUF1800 domain-containing protein [Ktedonobacterales bacterium]
MTKRQGLVVAGATAAELGMGEQELPGLPGDETQTDVPESTATHRPLVAQMEAPTRQLGKPPRKGISRRAALISVGVGALGLGAVGTGVGAALLHRLTSPPDIFTVDAGRIAHLLRRAGFGPSPSDIGDYLDAGVDGAIDHLLSSSSVSNDALDQRLAGLHLDFTKVEDAIRWFLLRMIYSRRPLEEKLTLFWHGVLTSSLRKLGGKANYPLMIHQNQLLRAKGMGRFDDLLHAITIDPAMLYWLDGRLSSGNSPNENYSREMMELFAMGLGNYTQNDVHQGALALTGWVVRDGKSVFVPRRHYTGTVNFLGHSGKMGVDDIVNIVAAHPATGKYLARRMWSFFVYDNPSDGDLQPLVDAYYHNDHSIGTMVRAMLKSPAFFGTKAYRARVKSPMEFLAGAIRGLGLETTGTGMTGIVTSLGQIPFEPPNVAGWPGDKASPAWISTQAWLTRVNFTNLLATAATGTTPQSAKRATAPNITTAGSHPPVQEVIDQRKIKTPAALADYYIAALLDNQIDASHRTLLHDAAAQKSAKGPSFTLDGGTKVAAASMRQMLYLLMSAPEYQMN